MILYKTGNKFLLRGNGNITGFYSPVDGLVSTYQNNFKPTKASKKVQRTSGNAYVSSIMTVTPDPRMFKNQQRRVDNMKESLNQVDKKLQQTNSMLHKAMDRVLTK